MPFFNRQNNDDLILAIQAAGVSRGRNGFRKDKGGEKLAESEEDLLEISCQREQSWACSNYAECSRYYATPHRRHRRFRYSLHRLREISISRRFQREYFGRFVKNFRKIRQNLRLNRIAVLNICSTLILSLQMDFAKKCLITYDVLILYIRKNS